jgi:DNA-binding PadR family transcriptional regulator
MTKTQFIPTQNQRAVLGVLSDGEASAQQVAKSKGVTAGQTSIYNSLRALKERGLVVEKKVKTGVTPKGDRFAYRLSAKGKRLLGV